MGTAPNTKLSHSERIDIITRGRTFEFLTSTIVEGSFTCICGARGDHAYVAIDNMGREVKVEPECLHYLHLTTPKKILQVGGVKKEPRKKKVKLSPPTLIFDTLTAEEYAFLNKAKKRKRRTPKLGGT